MRKLSLNEHHPDELVVICRDMEITMGKNVFTRLSLAFPTELVCPQLQKLK